MLCAGKEVVCPAAAFRTWLPVRARPCITPVLPLLAVHAARGTDQSRSKEDALFRRHGLFCKHGSSRKLVFQAHRAIGF